MLEILGDLGNRFGGVNGDSPTIVELETDGARPSMMLAYASVFVPAGLRDSHYRTCFDICPNG